MRFSAHDYCLLLQQFILTLTMNTNMGDFLIFVLIFAKLTISAQCPFQGIRADNIDFCCTTGALWFLQHIGILLDIAYGAMFCSAKSDIKFLVQYHSWAPMVKKTSIGSIPIIDWRQKTSIRSMVVIRKKILSRWIDKIGQKSNFFHRWSIPSVKLLKVLTDGSIPLV
jgi:hypothetical protein